MLRALAALLAVLAVAGCGGGGGESGVEQAPPDMAAPPSDGTALGGTTLDGETVTLADFRGKPLFVNVWSSWWTTCQSEAVAYAEFVQSHPELGYLGLNVADTPDEARRFLEEKGWAWPQLRDPDRVLAKSIGADYQPHVILFDAEGEPVGSFEGGGTAADWEALLARL